MASQAEVLIMIRAKNEASAAFKDVAGDAREAESALGSVAKVAGGFVLAQGIIAAPNVLAGLRDTAADLELQMKKANVVFGDQMGVVKEWADENAHSMGLTKREATNAAAGFADLLIPMGFARDEAAKMSTDVVGLSGALSEWSGGTKSATEVSAILAKAMLGEREGLKELGISISEADVQMRLAKNGTSEMTGAALEQAKAIATQQLIFEKSTDAQTAFAEGSDSAARRTAEFNAQLKEWKETAALAVAGGFQALTLAAAAALPPIEATIGFLADHKEVLAGVGATLLVILTPAIVAWTLATWANVTAHIALAAAALVAYAPLILLAVGVGLLVAAVILLIKHWDEIWPKIKEIAVGVLTALRDVFVFFKEWVIEHWRQIAFGILAVLFPPGAGLFLIITHFGEIRDFVMGVVNSIVEFVGGLPGRITALIGAMFESALGFGRAIKDGIVSGIQEIAGSVEDIAGAIRNALKGAINSALRWAHDNISISVPGFNPPGPGSIPGFDWNFPLIQLASGVRNFQGGMALVGEHGPEIVALPRGADVYSNSESRQMAAAGTTVVNNYTIYVNTQEIHGSGMADLAAAMVNV